MILRDIPALCAQVLQQCGEGLPAVDGNALLQGLPVGAGEQGGIHAGGDAGPVGEPDTDLAVCEAEQISAPGGLADLGGGERLLRRGGAAHQQGGAPGRRQTEQAERHQCHEKKGPSLLHGTTSVPLQDARFSPFYASGGRCAEKEGQKH